MIKKIKLNYRRFLLLCKSIKFKKEKENFFKKFRLMKKNKSFDHDFFLNGVNSILSQQEALEKEWTALKS